MTVADDKLAGLLARLQTTLDHAVATGENPTSQRALEYRIGEAIDYLRALPASGGEGVAATWHKLDEEGYAELRVNGKRITTFASYPAAEEAATRINAALSLQQGEVEPGYEKALHWIDRYASGIDAEPQMARIAAALTRSQP